MDFRDKNKVNIDLNHIHMNLTTEINTLLSLITRKLVKLELFKNIWNQLYKHVFLPNDEQFNVIANSIGHSANKMKLTYLELIDSRPTFNYISVSVWLSYHLASSL